MKVVFKNLLKEKALITSFFFFILSVLLVGSYPLGNSSETREAHVVKLMIEEGDFILPLRHGLVPSKPPFFHWLSALSTYIFNPLSSRIEVSALTARLPSALAATLMLVTLAWLTLRLTAGDKLSALIAVTILGTSYGFVAMSQRAMVDMVFASGVVAAIAVLAAPIFERQDKDLHSFYTVNQKLLFAFFCGLCVLSKGPLGIILPVLISSAILLSRFKLQEVLRFLLRPNIGWPVFLVIALPWYILAYHEQPSGFLERQLLFENIKRVLGGSEVNTQPFWFYVPSILRTTSPWSILAFGIAAYKLYKGESFDRLTKLGLVWFASGFTLFSLASGKRHSYLLPIYPALVLIILPTVRAYITQRAEKADKNLEFIAKIFFGVITFGAIFYGTLLLSHVFGIDIEQKLISKALISKVIATWIYDSSPFFCLAFLIAASGRIFFARKETIFAFSLLSVSTFIIIVGLGAGVKNSLRDYWQIADDIEVEVSKDTVFYAARPMYDGGIDPLLFYLDLPVKPVPESFCKEEFPPVLTSLLIERDYFAGMLNLSKEELNMVKNPVFLDAKLSEVNRYHIEAHKKSLTEEFILYSIECNQ